MLVDVDEPIESYKEQVFLGMDLTTSAIFAAAIVGCIGYIAVSVFVLGIPLAAGAYTCCIPAAAIVFFGKKVFMDGMPLLEKRRKRKLTRENISFHSTECADRLEEYLADIPSVQGEQGSEEDMGKAIRQTVLALAGIILMVAAVLAVAALFKKGYI